MFAKQSLELSWNGSSTQLVQRRSVNPSVEALLDLGHCQTEPILLCTAAKE